MFRYKNFFSALLQNGTFIGPVFSVPLMMFAGFGVTLRDLPGYLKWGSYIIYLRYGLEGYIGALFFKRQQLDCYADYCHYKYACKFSHRFKFELISREKNSVSIKVSEQVSKGDCNGSRQIFS